MATNADNKGPISKDKRDEIDRLIEDVMTASADLAACEFEFGVSEFRTQGELVDNLHDAKRALRKYIFDQARRCNRYQREINYLIMEGVRKTVY